MGLSWWNSLFKRSRRPEPTGLAAVQWIVAQTDAALEICEAGPFPTPSGQVAILDPLCLMQALEPNLVPVPPEGGRVVVFHDSAEGRNSKLALVFSDADVAGGNDVATCGVDAGMASVFTPETHAAILEFATSLGEDGNIYDDYFCRFDDPAGGERKIVNLPDGTPVPYVHSGWGDGGYPVFTLTDSNGNLCAVYVDFMGRNEDGEWLTPPGVTLD